MLRYLKGMNGEKAVLEILKELGDDFRIYNDVILKDIKRYVQFDIIVVSKFGIYVIEVKNWSGTLSGDCSKSFIWHLNKKRVYSPAKQVSIASSYLKTTLGLTKNVHPLVYVVGSCILKNVCRNVINKKFDLLEKIELRKEIVLDDDELEFIKDEIEFKNRTSWRDKIGQILYAKKVNRQRM